MIYGLGMLESGITFDLAQLVLDCEFARMIKHTVNGIPVSHFIGEQRLAEIVQRTRGGGAEILALRKNSSAYDAPGASVASMVDAISHHRNRLLPCVAILDDEYGMNKAI